MQKFLRERGHTCVREEKTSEIQLHASSNSQIAKYTLLEALKKENH